MDMLITALDPALCEAAGIRIAFERVEYWKLTPIINEFFGLIIYSPGSNGTTEYS
jgi:hypothetical protein